MFNKSNRSRPREASMSRPSFSILPLLLCTSATSAQTSNASLIPNNPSDPAAVVVQSPWAGSSGELGFSSSRGNSTAENLNGRLKARYNEGDWIHSLDLFANRSISNYTETAEDGSVHRYRQTTVERYTGAVGTALQLGEFRQLTATGRHERDRFATYDRLTTFGIGYGTRLINGNRFSLDTQVGPGIRRAHNAYLARTEIGPIGRGLLDMKYHITDNTDLINNLLIEVGAYNNYMQNDLGVQVAMSQRFAFKAAWQLRHNSEVNENDKKTNTLTTVNLVYSFK
ncbi:DUF481 domain-containing protein [Xylella fastidiosa subsp. fastidiosa]|uniref:DUF481 domain-containing protein n=3 Tax=Xylella fastidiosa TaxID=2371 RepID=Q87CD0_XYLFT|nr:conserved hypothetical protein [Xylella fastidiosa Temecula1]NBI38901.1 DUF481 domain-containing protein [Xylella fastidiosa subsp. fastidiosa]QIS25899.1 DUF481 domain-containing protein [Xylella fastidiosa]RWA43922.1 DUF481 domain-containing protein [Xylella fastidiosa subsp. sandyi]QMT65000.1 DUF481 domain-containing protein [Xylella fastidiosa subsp. fastidiosa]